MRIRTWRGLSGGHATLRLSVLLIIHLDFWSLAFGLGVLGQVALDRRYAESSPLTSQSRTPNSPIWWRKKPPQQRQQH